METDTVNIRDEHEELRGADDLKEIVEGHLRAPAYIVIPAKCIRQAFQAGRER